MFKNNTIQQYTDILSSQTPTPGGGSALAVIGANAIALVEMAVNVTANKLANKGLDTTAYAELADKLILLRNKMLKLADDDSTAFDNIIALMKLPKDTAEQIALRKNKLQQAYLTGASVPLEVMDTAYKGIQIADTVIEIADKYVQSDAVIGKSILQSVIDNSLHNVLANTCLICDAEIKQQLEDKAQQYLNETNK